VIRLACWKPRFANRTGAHLGPSNRATALDGARCAPTPLAGGARAGLAAVRAQYPAAARLLTPSVASHQRAARTSWRGPIDTLQFFHSGQQLRTDDSARRDVQNTRNLAFAAPIFSLGPQQPQPFFCYVNNDTPPTRSVPEMERPSRPGVRTAAGWQQPHARSACKKWAAGLQARGKNAPTSAVRTAGWGMAACEPTEHASLSAHCPTSAH
jgi:hypothetical protein